MTTVQDEVNEKLERIATMHKRQGDMGEVVLLNHTRTIYRISRDREEDAFLLANYLGTYRSIDFNIEEIQIDYTAEHFLVNVIFLQQIKWTSLEELKEKVLADESRLRHETGIYISPKDILIDYEVEVQETPYAN